MQPSAQGGYRGKIGKYWQRRGRSLKREEWKQLHKTHQTGNLSENRFECYSLLRGLCIIKLPPQESADYILYEHSSSIVAKIQVKSAHIDAGGYRSNLAKHGNCYCQADADWFWIYNFHIDTCWILPSHFCVDKASIYLGPKFDLYKEPINPHPDYPTRLCLISPQPTRKEQPSRPPLSTAGASITETLLPTLCFEQSLLPLLP